MLITREDIQRIGDEDTLMHFLEEKLNLPISEGTTLAQIALPLPLPFLGLDESIAEQIIDCQDLRGLPKDAWGKRRPFLIRFRHQSGYAELLRAIAESLHQKRTNPTDFFFICANEYFRPFAIAYFNDSASEDWRTAVLNIRAWTQENTHIHTSSEHKLPADFFPKSTSQPVVSTSPGALLTKFQKIGTPLGRLGGIDIHSGIPTGHHKAFVINEHIREQMLAEEPKSIELIKRIPKHIGKWRCESSNIIYIPSSKNRRWPWSGINNQSEAEQIFKTTYPAISKHLYLYRNRLERRQASGDFYWELPAYKLYSTPEHSKIFYPPHGSMQAAYDRSEGLPLSPTYFILTKDLSLLAILNSKLFNWYAHKKCKSPNPEIKQLSFSKQNMENVPIAPRTEKQKVGFLNLVQDILDDPDSPEVPDLEREIDQLVYKLYKLTDVEIALIEEEANQ